MSPASAWRATLACALVAVASCAGDHTERGDVGTGAGTPPTAAAPGSARPAGDPAAPRRTTQPDAESTPGGPMPSSTPGQPLPTPFDARVTAVLANGLPADVVIEFAQVSMGKLPYSNYRWRLHRDGQLLYSVHSRTPGDWQVPFDQPWPTKPALTLEADRRARLLASLEAAGFFRHAGYEADPDVDGGAFYIVRARSADAVNAVVYQNLTPPPVPDLIAVAQPLHRK